MLRNKYGWIFVVSLLLGVFSGCVNELSEQPEHIINEDIESGSIGKIVKVLNTKWELHLADDNDNPNLPDRWRNWWYIKMDNIVPDVEMEFTLKNRGWPYYYLPVYSYDQEEWHRFTEEEVSQNENDELIIKKQFSSQTVWMARFYPYTFTDLETYISNINGSPYLNIETPGYSQDGKPIYLFKVTNFDIPDSSKKRIFMHARTHPAETPSSFLLEGMISFLLSGTSEATEILSKYEFYIFPMQNVDGVDAGNYRSTPQSENLEVMWFYDNNNSINLNGTAPQEVNIIHQYAKNLMSDGGPPISMALNLHASNSEPDIRPFFFPHFGTEAQGYTTVESSLWKKQLHFISSLATHHGVDMIEPVPEQGGRSFASKTYPESWWWVNFQDQVMAITMEMTYGRAGYAPRWIEPGDLRDLGVSLALTINDYYSTPISSKSLLLKSGRNMKLKYPELYPPNAEDELKK